MTRHHSQHKEVMWQNCTYCLKWLLLPSILHILLYKIVKSTVVFHSEQPMYLKVFLWWKFSLQLRWDGTCSGVWSCVWIHATDMYTNRGRDRERKTHYSSVSDDCIWHASSDYSSGGMLSLPDNILLSPFEFSQPETEKNDWPEKQKVFVSIKVCARKRYFFISFNNESSRCFLLCHFNDD